MKRFFALLLLACLLPGCALAHQKGFGEFGRDRVNVRKTPGGPILFRKQAGEEVFIRSWKEYRGQTWYEVSTYDAERVRPLTAWVQAGMILPPDTLFHDVVQVAAYMEHMIALKKDGTVIYGGQRHQYPETLAGEHPRTWRNVRQVAAGFYSVYGLKQDGSLYKWGIRGPANGLPGVVSNGRTVPFAAISAQDDGFLGLMEDGSLYSFKGNEERQLLPPGSGIEHFSAWWSLYGDGMAIRNGKAETLSANAEVDLAPSDRDRLSQWSGIEQVATGFYTPTDKEAAQKDRGGLLAAAILKDGTAVALDAAMNKEVQGWSNVAKLVFGDGFLLGLTKDGRVYAAGKRANAVPEVHSWTDIVDIACGFDYCVGVTREGKLLFAGTADFHHR